MERLIFKNAGMMVKVGFLVAVIVLFGATRVHAADIVDIARSQIGQGEIGGDNQGPVVKKFTHGQEVAWCAAFVAWTLHKAGKTTPYMLAARSYLNVGTKVKNPKPGDVVVFTRKGGGHVGIVESVEGGRLVTIEGNVGKFPAKVKRMTYRLNNIPNLLGFIRV